MSIIVSKFGGSSAANAEMFMRIRQIMDASPDRRYIVLSAPGACEGADKITNLLYQCHDLAESGGDHRPTLRRIQRRFSKIARDLSMPDPEKKVAEEIEAALRISRDHTASRGEYLCALLFSSWSGKPMADAARLIAFSGDGHLDQPRTLDNIARAAGAHPQLIIPGFYGALPDGRIHTFPRNGSDITGALVAAGVGADLYENWTDVDGFMSADPSLVPEARLNPQVSYRQMRALAQAGARVLHPDCLGPVSALDIPTRLCNARHPERPGTLITNDFDRIAPCVTGKPDFFCLRAHGFTHETRTCLTRIPHQIFITTAGEEIALTQTRPTGICMHAFHPVACISVFGMTREQEISSLQRISPIAVIDAADHFKVLVPPDKFEDALRLMHRTMLDGFH